METNLAYPFDEDVKQELIHSRVVAMASPTVKHGTIVENIHSLFRRYLKGRRCRTFSDHIDVRLTEEDTYVPDVTVVCDPAKITDDGIDGAPDLVVEVLSPSTAKNDRSDKKTVYEQCGVREYWIVDPVSLTVEQYLLENGTFTLRDVYTHPSMDRCAAKRRRFGRPDLPTEFPCGIFPDLTIRLDDVFEDVVTPPAAPPAP